jgi:hypothetical protein
MEAIQGMNLSKYNLPASGIMNLTLLLLA